MIQNAYAGIGEYQVYIERMAGGMMDKLFFVDKAPAQVVVDYGCADGMLLHHLAPWYKQAHFIGYDTDSTMIAAATTHLKPLANRLLLTDSWSSVAAAVADAHEKGEQVAVVLSSIIHEIYHYSDVREVDAFWTRIFESGFDFIILRDMIPSRSLDRVADVNDIAKVYHRYLHTRELRDFETRWGSIDSNKNLVHWLLKYQYTSPNWEREVKENYVPLYREDLLAMVPRVYDIIYHEHYVLPYLRRIVQRDFQIDLKDPTHLKMILEKRAGPPAGDVVEPSPVAPASTLPRDSHDAHGTGSQN